MRKGRFYSTQKNYIVLIIIMLLLMGVGYATLEKQLNGSITINISKYQSATEPTGGAQMLINKANSADKTYNNVSSTQKGEMFAFNHAATIQTTALTDYRYIGNNPNNYIDFNNEVWRIIGVFNGKIKIIKDTAISSDYYDLKNGSTENLLGSSQNTGDGTVTAMSNNTGGSNDWSDAQLMYALNPTSYTLKSNYRLDGDLIKDASGNIIYRLGYAITFQNIGDTSYNTTNRFGWSLNTTALSQVSNEKYYLGAITSETPSAEDIYSEERGNSTCYTNSKCLAERPTNWTGKVGLMYPSDYIYTYGKGVVEECYNSPTQCKNSQLLNGWLYKETEQRTITPSIDSSDVVYNASYYKGLSAQSAGGNKVTLLSTEVVSNTKKNKPNTVSRLNNIKRLYVISGGDGPAIIGYTKYIEVLPVVYLKSNIQLTGTGSSDNHYQITN